MWTLFGLTAGVRSLVWWRSFIRRRQILLYCFQNACDVRAVQKKSRRFRWMNGNRREKIFCSHARNQGPARIMISSMWNTVSLDDMVHVSETHDAHHLWSLPVSESHSDIEVDIFHCAYWTCYPSQSQVRSDLMTTKVSFRNVSDLYLKLHAPSLDMDEKNIIVQLHLPGVRM